MVSGARSSESDCEECLRFLQEHCPPIYVGLGEGLRFLPPATQAAYLRLLRRLVQLAPKNWSKDDPDISDRTERLHNANVRLVKRLAHRRRFCGHSAAYVFERIEHLYENVANRHGREGRAYSFAAHRIIRLVGSMMRAESAEPGFRVVVLNLPKRKPTLKSDEPTTGESQCFAKILPFKRP
jgi:hypothetical protein